jgi:hypothetical protein
MILNKCTEESLYQLLKDKFLEDLSMTKRTNARTDCYSEKFNLDIELKCRRTHYNELLIEKKKHDALMHRCKINNTTPLYINCTPKGIWAFYISDIRIIWSEKMLPAETDFSNRKFIKKTVGYLKLKSGVDLTDSL